jgi:hypothetical protein
MMKRGQVAIFIIVGIVLGFSVAIIPVLKDLMETPGVPVFSDDVYSAISSCLEDVSEAAILVVFTQGGTYEEGNSDNFRLYKLAKPISKGDGVKAIEKNEEYEFTKENVREGVEVFFNEVFGRCINDIDFDKFEQEVVVGEFDVEVNVEDRFVLMELDFPITIEKGNVSVYLDSFIYKKKVDVKKMVNIVGQIVDASVEENFPPYELMDDLEEEYGLDMDVDFVFEEMAIENMIYLIKFEKEHQVVAFAIHYDWYEYER